MKSDVTLIVAAFSALGFIAGITPASSISEKIDLAFAGAHFHHGLRKRAENDLQGALQEYNETIRLDKYHDAAFNNRGNVRSHLNDCAGALADYNRAIEINPRSATAYYNRASLVRSSPQKALDDLNCAILLNPSFGVAYFNRGSLRLFQLHDYSGAVDDFRLATRLSPERVVDAYCNLALAEANLNNHAAAIEDFGRVIEMKTLKEMPYRLRARSKLRLGDRRGALEDCNKALDINAVNTLALCDRGLVLAVSGRKEDALSDYRRALALRPNDPLSHYSFGTALLLWKDTAEAVKEFDKAIEKDSRHFAEPYFFRAFAKWELGQTKEAIEDYSKALYLPTNPIFAHVHYNALMGCTGEPTPYREIEQKLRVEANYALALHDLRNLEKVGFESQ